MWKERIAEERFGTYEIPYCEDALNYWRQRAGKSICSLIPEDEILWAVHKSVWEIPLRILIKDMHDVKQKGGLGNVSSKQQYENYNIRFLGNKEYCSKLENIYQELPRMMHLAANMAVDNILLMATRLINDKDLIISTLCGDVPFCTVLHIDIGISDIHEHGWRAIKVILDNGITILYKPHSLHNSVIYNEILNRLTRACKMKVYIHSLLNMKGYGWEKWISMVECKSEEQVIRYYRRMGIHLFLAYAFFITDLHAQNVIPCGEYPVVIDLETLPGNPSVYGTDPGSIIREGMLECEILAEKQLLNSVLQTGILPTSSFFGQGGIVCSALHPSGLQKTRMKMPIIMKDKTAEMFIGYEEQETRVLGGMPEWKGCSIPNERIIEALDNGFCEAWDAWTEAFRTKSTEWFSIIKSLYTERSRVVCRDTQLYRMIIQTSYFPEKMLDEKRRYNFLVEICHKKSSVIVGNNNDRRRKKREALLELYEIDSLSRGCIPVVYQNGMDTLLYMGNGDEVDGWFHESAYSLFVKRWGLDIEGNNNMMHSRSKEAKFQRMLLRCAVDQMFPSIAYEYNNVFYRIIKNMRGNHTSSVTHVRNVSDNVLHDSIRCIAEYLSGTMIVVNGKLGAAWIGMERMNHVHLEFRVAGYDLYNGLFGIAIFFEQLMNHESIPLYKVTLERACEALFYRAAYIAKQIEVNVEKTGAVVGGAFTGIASMLHGFTILYRQTKKKVYLQMARLLLPVVQNEYNRDEKYDLISGNAGTLYVISLFGMITGDEAACCLAKEIGEWLFNRLEVIAPSGGEQIGEEKSARCRISGIDFRPGMAHGISGFLLAFSALYRCTGEECYRKIMLELFHVEETLLDEKNHCIESEITENIAFQKEKNIFSQAQESTWCHGAAGFLMARMAMCEADPECRKLEMVRFSLEKHVEQVFRGNERMGNCLCHGWCGNWFIANLYIMKYGGSLLQKKELYLLQQVIIKRLGKMSAYETYHPGLMTGVTGIGLTCLLIHYQDFLSNSNLMPFRDK